MSTKSTKQTQRKPRAKKLNLKEIEKRYKDINTLTPYPIDKERNIVIKYYEQFPHDRIEAIIKEAYEQILYDKENNIGFLNKDENFIPFILFLTIKHMTDLQDEIPNELEAQITIFKQMVSNGLYERLLNDMFSPDQTALVIEKIATFASLTTQIAELNEETRNELLSKVQSPVIKKKLEQSQTTQEETEADA